MPKTPQKSVRKEADPAWRAEVGQRLLLSREIVGRSQSKFAEGASVQANTYNQNEHGVKLPSLETAIALCEAYDLTLDWIYRGETSGLRYEFVHALKALRTARTPKP